MSLKNFLTSKVFFKQVAIALLIIVIIVFLLLQWLDFTTNHGDKIQVPDLRKMTVTEAGQRLEDIDHKLGGEGGVNLPSALKWALEQNS